MISKETLQSTREFLQRRYATASTVPGARLFHHFKSDSIGILKFKRVSDDTRFVGHHNFLCPTTSFNAVDIPLMSYVCCVYDFQWWIGLVIKINYHENNLQINFLHPCGPSKYFYWPSHEDICWVSVSHILCKIHQQKLALAAAAICSASLKYVILKSEQRYIKTCYKF